MLREAVGRRQLARARSGRSEEQRADRLAAQYLVRAGYDPHAAVQFFQRLQAEEERSGGEPGGLLATHPRSVDRQKKLEKIIPNLPPPEFAPHDEAEFLRMRRAVRDYDEIYSRLVGVRVPGHDAPPPELSRRPPSPGLAVDARAAASSVSHDQQASVARTCFADQPPFLAIGSSRGPTSRSALLPTAMTLGSLPDAASHLEFWQASPTMVCFRVFHVCLIKSLIDYRFGGA